MAKQTQNNEKIKYNKFPLRKINFILMAVFGVFFADAFIRSHTYIECIRSYGDS